MTERWKIISPEAATNIVLNPSAELAGNFAAYSGATVTRVTTYARSGSYCYSIVPGGTARGISVTTATAAATDTYVTFYAWCPGDDVFSVTMNAGANWNVAAMISGGGPGALNGARYLAVVPAAQANGSTTLTLRDSKNNTFYVDCFQAEQSGLAHYTTYFDGDTNALCRWNGARCASTSTRDAQDRSGGWERDIFDTYGVRVRQFPGAGMPPVANNMQQMSLQPGAIFQSTRVLPRKVVFEFDVHHTSLANLHSRRQAFLDAIKHDATRGAQPFILGYTGASTLSTVYAAFRYASGLELLGITGGATYIEGGGRVPIGAIAVDPYWYEDRVECAWLAFTQTVASCAYAARRVNGQWYALGTGMNGVVNYVAVDPVRGYVYYGGSFTTANGVAVNRITYWNGTTFVAMDAGTNGEVQAMAIAANGDVWVAGSFTTVGAGATACNGLARWNLATSNWTAFNNASATFTAIYALAIDAAGNVYIGGDFTNWDGTGACDYIAKYNGAAWSALGTGANGSVNALAVGLDGARIYAAGAFTTANAVTVNRVTYWNGTTFVAMSSGLDASADSLLVTPDGTVYVGGSLTTAGGTAAAGIAAWNGAAWSALGSGVAGGAVYALAVDDRGSIIAGGSFTSAGGMAIADSVAGWNGSSWYQLDIDLPAPGIVYGLASNARGDIYAGGNFSSDATAAYVNSVQINSTASTYPILTLSGPTTAATSCTLQWIENQSTGERLYYNLPVYAGETYTIDLTRGKKTTTSDWRGVVPSQPLSNSDRAAWHLLPGTGATAGTNYIAAFVTGTTTGVTLTIRWQITHWSVDGAA